MSSAFTPNKNLEQPANNDYVDSWDIPVNADWAAIDRALGGSTNINLTGVTGVRLLLLNVAPVPPDWQALKIVAQGVPTGAVTLVMPVGVGGIWVVRNDTTGTFNQVSIVSAAGGAPIPIPAGTNILVTCDGSASGMFLAFTATPAGGANTQVQFNDNGILSGTAGFTWDKTTGLLTVPLLTVTGNTVLGNDAADLLTITGVPVTAAAGLNFNSDQLVLFGALFDQVGINIAAPIGTAALSVGGTIAASGLEFPLSTITTGPAGAAGNIQYHGPTAGSFAAEASFFYDDTTNILSVDFLDLNGVGATTGTGPFVLADSPILTGTPTAPKQPPGSGNSQIATIADIPPVIGTNTWQILQVINPAGAATFQTAAFPSDVKMLKIYAQVQFSVNGTSIEMNLVRGGVVDVSATYGYSSINSFRDSTAGSSFNYFAYAANTTAHLFGLVGVLPNTDGVQFEMSFNHLQSPVWQMAIVTGAFHHNDVGNISMVRLNTVHMFDSVGPIQALKFTGVGGTMTGTFVIMGLRA
jgi:hypothetical protein